MPNRNHAEEEKEDQLMRNVSNYTNLLEQQLLYDKEEPSKCIDTSGKSTIYMTNLSNEGIRKQTNKENEHGLDAQTIKNKNSLQKSLLANRVLQFKSNESQNAITGKSTTSYDFRNSLVNCDEMLFNDPTILTG